MLNKDYLFQKSKKFISNKSIHLLQQILIIRMKKKEIKPLLGEDKHLMNS